MFDIERLVRFLENPALETPWLQSLGIRNPDQAAGNLGRIAATGLTLDLVAAVCNQLEEHLPKASDPDRALNNLERFIQAARNPLAIGSLIERDRDALPTLLSIFSASQYLSDVLVRDPESFDLLRLTAGQPVVRQVLVDEICGEIDAAARDDTQAMAILRRYKHRETLRIAYGDLIGRQRLDTVARQISWLADAICEAALRYARGKAEAKWGPLLRSDGQPAGLAVLGLGKLGGEELNYSSDIDLILLCEDGELASGSSSIGRQEYFDRVQRTFIRLLTETTADGAAYRVDLRLRPHGSQGPTVVEIDSAIRYYDVSARTWERQAFVKARPVAGDLTLGRKFLDQLESWVYRRYLSRAEIAGIKALKRQIEQRSAREGLDDSNLKTGRGGIRDVEFVIQFLQLLNGGDIPELRTANTLEAIDRLCDAECLTMEERGILEKNYSFLRHVEHRLQIMFDMQTHSIPTDLDELRRLAIRSGYDAQDDSALEQFQTELRERTRENRSILDHLLHDAFADDQGADREADLILDPNPPAEIIASTLGEYGFGNIDDAYQRLLALATEQTTFLSTRRCRHFLASIARPLLQAIAATPEPYATLVELGRVSDSLGGKGVLWELFSSNAPSLQLYVRLCAASSYLSGLLTNNPGMIDELLDSLVLQRLPDAGTLDKLLHELFRGAEDVEPILHSFKDSAHLRIGVLDILGRGDIRSTHCALADVAEACLKQVALLEYQKLVEKYGEPFITPAEEAEGAVAEASSSDAAGFAPELARSTSGGVAVQEAQRCEFVILALGKLGGREPNYHSDLDIMFLYEAEGTTQPHRKRGESTSNQHFFAQLSQRIVKVLTQFGPFGRLYDVDSRLRPHGKSGALAISFREFTRYFRTGHGQLWERQALCKARPVYGSDRARAEAMESVRNVLTEHPWKAEMVDEIREMRRRLEQTASPRNLKRAPGGTMDVEFLVQALQLKHANRQPGVLTPGTLDALAALSHHGLLDADTAEQLIESYRFLRSVESGLRLMATTSRHDLPEDPKELKRLAYLLGNSGPQQLESRCREMADRNRAIFQQELDKAR